jgi:biotin carboxylase
VVDSGTLDATTGRLIRRLGTVVDTAGLGPEAAAAALADARPEGVVTFVDDHLEAAADLADRLGLPYHSPAVARTLVDKRLQRLALAEAGVPGPEFWAIPAGVTAEALCGIADSVTYPAVLKPAEGSGSREIHSVAGPEELLAVVGGNPVAGHRVERYLEDLPGGDRRFAGYLSAESVVSGGRVSHVALTGRFPLAEPFRETGNFIPALLADDLVPEVLQVAGAALDALGIRDAVTHTEIKLTPEGPKVIEVNGRLGGRPPFVLRSVSDVNLFQVACRVATGVPVSFDHLVETHGVGYWLMLQAPMWARRLEVVEGLDEVSTMKAVDTVSLDLRRGAALDWREGTDSHVVTVQGRVADHEELATAVTDVQHRISITYGG